MKRVALTGIDCVSPLGLDAPSKLDNEVNEMLTAARADLAKVEADIKADPQAFMDSDQDPFASTNARANAIGLTVCGNP